MSQSPFQKFSGKKKNSVIKEEFRQEKKKARAEKNAYFDRLKEEKYQAMLAKRAARNKENEVSKNHPDSDSKSTRKNVSPSFPSKKTGTAKNNAVRNIPASMPLNKFLAHCGVCSRRDAIVLIADEKVKVNGQVMTQPGYKVQPEDKVVYNGKTLFVTKNLVYILLNKPKDYITTTDDPQGRKTVLQLIKHATDERVYPVGRLDRNTSGVLLLTNDGDLTQKLSHPSYEVKKIYEVKLDKHLTKTDFDKILSGLLLEDGPVYVDSLAYADSKDKSVIGIEIHSGRNRIVRRIFEHLGYDVKNLDRVMYAGLTKKNVERSKWRYLNDKEIRLLKYMNESKGKKKNATEQADSSPVKTIRQPRNPEMKMTDAEIEAAIESPLPKAKSDKKKKPSQTTSSKTDKGKTIIEKKPGTRKFKTHSEKKKHQQNGGKK